ncbi:unnamed protein product [Eretmochelys imbricata]
MGDCKAQQSSVSAEAGSRGCDRGTYLAADSNSGLTEPKKLPNPVRESKTHQELHRELLFSHSRGLLPGHKPELQKVLETRRFKQLKQQQESQRPRTDLEEELRKRHRMLEQPELARNMLMGLSNTSRIAVELLKLQTDREESDDDVDSHNAYDTKLLVAFMDMLTSMERRFWTRETHTEGWDHIVMQLWDDEQWLQSSRDEFILEDISLLRHINPLFHI